MSSRSTIVKSLKDTFRPTRDLLVHYFALAKPSYSQAGEDMIIRVAAGFMGLLRPTYLDIGANDPRALSNTYYFYRRGSHGVCVEANPDLCRVIRRWRRRDTCVHAAVGPDSKAGTTADFYLLTAHEISTFSKEDAEQYVRKGLAKIKRVAPVKFVTINQVIAQHFTVAPDILSIDVEGMDLEILQSLDFSKYRPKIICAETIGYVDQAKDQEVIDFLVAQDYRVFGDTFLNTIFTDNRVWKPHRAS